MTKPLKAVVVKLLQNMEEPVSDQWDQNVVGFSLSAVPYGSIRIRQGTFTSLHTQGWRNRMKL